MNDEVSLETMRMSLEFGRIGNRAVRKAQERNRRLGIPNVYSIHGKIVYELPDGTITTARVTAEKDGVKPPM